jgi:hypothetical protein
VTPTGSIRVEVESKPNEDRVETDVPPSITDTSVKVIKVDSTTVSLIIMHISHMASRKALDVQSAYGNIKRGNECECGMIQQTLNVKATVQNAGDYVFVVHYYQPYHTSVEVIANVSADYVFPGVCVCVLNL